MQPRQTWRLDSHGRRWYRNRACAGSSAGANQCADHDYPRGDEPWFILTADFIMVGDVARPDLAQEGDEGAPVLYDVSIPRFSRFARLR